MDNKALRKTKLTKIKKGYVSRGAAHRAKLWRRRDTSAIEFNVVKFYDTMETFLSFIKKIIFVVSNNLLGAESFVFQFAIQNSEDQDTQNYNFAPCPVWVWNLVADIEGGT